MNLDIFVPGVGQHENIGDVILRRQLLNRMREYGPLHVYVGASSSSYERALGLGAEDAIYRSFTSWYVKALRGAIEGTATYVFKPGEIQLTLKGLKEHISVLPVITAARMRAKPIVRVGSGSRNFARIPRALMRPSVSLATFVRWRDGRTAEYFGGESMPDLAFAEGGSIDNFYGDRDVRDTLIVSMRADRGATPTRWIETLRRLAENEKLKIVAVSQVLRDNEKAEELARRLGGEAVVWNGGEHVSQEMKLRDLYRRSRFAVSDRLHVLITALTEGAVPAALLTHPSDKIERHFNEVDIADIARCLSSDYTDAMIDEWFRDLLERRRDMFDSLELARISINAVFSNIERVFVTKKSDSAPG